MVSYRKQNNWSLGGNTSETFQHKDSEHVPMICEQLYDLAMLAHKPLAPDAMTKFVARSNQILMLLAK